MLCWQHKEPCTSSLQSERQLTRNCLLPTSINNKLCNVLLYRHVDVTFVSTDPSIPHFSNRYRIPSYKIYSKKKKIMLKYIHPHLITGNSQNTSLLHMHKNCIKQVNYPCMIINLQTYHIL